MATGEIWPKHREKNNKNYQDEDQSLQKINTQNSCSFSNLFFSNNLFSFFNKRFVKTKYANTYQKKNTILVML